MKILFAYIALPTLMKDCFQSQNSLLLIKTIHIRKQNYTIYGRFSIIGFFAQFTDFLFHFLQGKSEPIQNIMS